MGKSGKVMDISKKKETKLAAKSSSGSREVNISGVGQIFSSGAHKLRRLVWLIVLVIMSTFLVYQIHSRINNLLDNPIIQSSSNVYVKELTFPAVTICNQNYFRISHTMHYMRGEDRASPVRQLSVYEVVAKFMNLLSEKVKNQAMLTEDANHVTSDVPHFNLDQFYYNASHQKRDMIKRCVFNGEVCDSEWFQPIRSDAGVCYRFNGNHTGTLKTDLRGRNGGLHLVLNVEQYEYTHGRTNSAGVALLIQDQSEIPNLIRNEALAVGPGDITSIALRTVNRTSEVSERCGVTNLLAFPDSQNYSRPACELDCLTRYINDSCGCIHFFMPRRDKSVTKRCYLNKILSCVYPHLILFSTEVDSDKVCACRTPCHIKYYQTSESRTVLSSFAANSLIRKKTFSEDVFLVYFRGMMFRDWGLILDNSPLAADDLHQIVFTVNDTRVTSYHYIHSLENNWNGVENTDGCLSPRVGNLMALVFKNGIHFLNPMVPGNSLSRTIDLSVGLSHSLLNNMPFNESKVGQIYRSCGLVASTLTDIIHELESTCIGSLVNCSMNDTNPICAFYELTEQYEAVFYNYSRSTEDIENSYNKLRETLSLTLGKSYPIWNDDSVDVQFYRDNYAEVDIFFQELAITEIKEKNSYGPIAFLCDVGGSLGLCLGGSLLTIFEIIDALWLFCCCAKPKRTSNP